MSACSYPKVLRLPAGPLLVEQPVTLQASTDRGEEKWVKIKAEASARPGFLQAAAARYFDGAAALVLRSVKAVSMPRPMKRLPVTQRCAVKKRG